MGGSWTRLADFSIRVDNRFFFCSYIHMPCYLPVKVDHVLRSYACFQIWMHRKVLKWLRFYFYFFVPHIVVRSHIIFHFSVNPWRKRQFCLVRFTSRSWSLATRLISDALRSNKRLLHCLALFPRLETKQKNSFSQILLTWYTIIWIMAFQLKAHKHSRNSIPGFEYEQSQTARD